MPMDRKQRRLAVKEAHAYFQKKGLSPEVANVKLVLFVRQLAKVLNNKKNAQRASDMAKEAQKVLERSMDHNRPEQALACRKGCNHCCHNFVSATAPQIFRLVRAIGEDGEILNQIRRHDQETRDLPKARRASERQPCALLVEGACSQYEHRPTACRGMASHDEDTCIERESGIHIPLAYNVLRGLTDFAVIAALKSCDLPHATYELHHALRLALETPQAEQRWLEGEDIFKSVQRDEWDDGSSDTFLEDLIMAASGNATDILNARLP